MPVLWIVESDGILTLLGKQMVPEIRYGVRISHCPPINGRETCQGTGVVSKTNETEMLGVRVLSLPPDIASWPSGKAAVC